MESLWKIFATAEKVYLKILLIFILTIKYSCCVNYSHIKNCYFKSTMVFHNYLYFHV